MEKELKFFPTWTAGRKGYAERIRQVYNEYLYSKGLRPTPQREFILNYLLEADRHLTQEEIYQAVRHKRIGKVTVFRMLKLLEACDLADQVHTSTGISKYEIKKERPHHDHLICIECGDIREVQWPGVEKIQEKTCKEIGFVPLWHRHEVFGRCQTCSNERV
ncbi:MAG: transcriptional repressor [Deltaproteobacteria bacterium]|nr:transcriptional repressor [Deltaproteobacteria bacterium]